MNDQHVTYGLVYVGIITKAYFLINIIKLMLMKM